MVDVVEDRKNTTNNMFFIVNINLGFNVLLKINRVQINI